MCAYDASKHKFSLVKVVDASYRSTYSAGISQEVRANRLDVAVGRGAELADRLEVLLASPPFRQDGQWQVDLHGGRHCVV
jgi:hypothetical protein